VCVGREREQEGRARRRSGKGGFTSGENARVVDEPDVIAWQFGSRYGKQQAQRVSQEVHGRGLSLDPNAIYVVVEFCARNLDLLSPTLKALPV
jgi:hypothetical protein